MRTKVNTTQQQVTNIGGPRGGTVSALGIGRDTDGYTFFLGGPVGLYRAVEFGSGLAGDWERLPNAPIGIVSLAVSPNFTQDHTIFAGTNTGLFVSNDGGDTWLAGKMPLTGSVVNVISFSPDYADDGSLLAGTLEDGIMFSNTRGVSWSSRNFGLLDAAVFSISFSPEFAKDETAFAGTDTAVYHSYNGGRAWKMADFPESAPPAMSLVVSPDFEHDRTLFVGTEAEGLHRSTDAGATWSALSLPAACINALLFRQASDILAATDTGVFRSQDQGDTWSCVLDHPDVISLAAMDEVVLAGPAHLGAWVTTDLQSWQPAENLSVLPVLGVALPEWF